MPENEETITIPVSEYNDLVDAAAFLARLEEAGVDNWEGYGDA